MQKMMIESSMHIKYSSISRVQLRKTIIYYVSDYTTEYQLFIIKNSHFVNRILSCR
jgi:hypothetical protein